jgi:hypothetical protein
MTNYANPQDPQPPLQAADIRIQEQEAPLVIHRQGPVLEMEHQRGFFNYVDIKSACAIGFRAFYRCRFLQVVELPISIVQRIYREAFLGCQNLKYIISAHPSSDVIRQKVRFDAQVIRRSELPAGYYSWGSSDKISWLEDNFPANQPNDNQSDTLISFHLSLQ